MTFKQFDDLTEEIFQKIRSLRDTKGKEYARNDNLDRLKNFTDIAQECNINPLKVWQVYFKKHTRAIDSFVTNHEVLSESIESRFLDALTYLLLGYALIVDRTEQSDSVKLCPRCSHISDTPGPCSCSCHPPGSPAYQLRTYQRD